MDWAAAFLLATMLGQALGMIGRFVPAIPNVVIPKIVLGTNFLANLVLWANKFLEATGIQYAGQNWWEPTDFNSHVALAGLPGFLKPIIAACAAALIAYAQLMVQRLVHEKGIKPVFQSGEPGSF